MTMRTTLSKLALLVLILTSQAMGGTMPGVLGFKFKSLDGADVDLASYKGQVVMFVNVASKCGYTKQYAPLEQLHEKYGPKGLVVVGVPVNDFGKQEPG